MRILQVITGLGVGGAETQLLSLSDSLAARGHQVLIVYLTNPLIIAPNDSRVILHAVGMVKGPIGMLRGFLDLRSAIAGFEPDVVHSHMLHSNLLTRVARLCTRVPRLVNTVHCTVETRSKWLRLAYRLSDGIPNVTTFVSEEAAEIYVGQGLASASKALPIHNGIDVHHFCKKPDARSRVRLEFGIDETAHVVIAIGRLAEEKDYPNLLRAVAHAFQHVMHAVLLIVGTGRLHSELVALSESLGLSNRVIFTGLRRDIPELLSASDTLALSSAYEGFGLVVAEAMACEVIVVATDCGGVKEVVGGAGLLVPPKSDSTLAAALLRAIQMPERERESMKKAARLRVEENFSMEQTVSKWEELYRTDRPI